MNMNKISSTNTGGLAWFKQSSVALIWVWKRFLSLRVIHSAPACQLTPQIPWNVVGMGLRRKKVSAGFTPDKCGKRESTVCWRKSTNQFEQKNWNWAIINYFQMTVDDWMEKNSNWLSTALSSNLLPYLQHILHSLDFHKIREIR